MRMWINRPKTELAREQENHGSRSAQASVSSSFPLSRLEQPIERFEKAIGLSTSDPGHDAIEVLPDHLGHLLHGVDLGAHDIGTPLQQHTSNDVDLLALQNLAQLLPVLPSASRAQAGQPGE